MKLPIIENAKKRTFEQIREAILEVLDDNPKTTTDIAREIKSSWLTTKRHLQWLHFLGKVRTMRKGRNRLFYKRLMK